MRLDLSEEQEFLRETTRRFLENEAPLTAIRQQFDSPEGFARDWWARASQLGWTSLGLPEEMGGAALSAGPAQDLAIIAEELGRIVGPGPFVPTAVCLDALASSEDHERFAALTAEILAGREIAAWAFAE